MRSSFRDRLRVGLLAAAVAGVLTGPFAGIPVGALGQATPAVLWHDDTMSAQGWFADDADAPWATDATGAETVLDGAGGPVGVRFVFDATRGRGKATLGRTYPVGQLDGRKATHFRVVLDTDAALFVSMSVNDEAERYFGLPASIVAAGAEREVFIPIGWIPETSRATIIRPKINISGYSPTSRVVLKSLALVVRDETPKPDREERPREAPKDVAEVVGFEARRGLPHAASAAKPSVAPIGAVIERNRLTEYRVDAGAAYANPYDPADVTVDVEFTSPTGRLERVPAFYYWPFERDIVEGLEQLRAGDAAQWRVRHTPRQAGEWTMRAIVSTPQGTTRGDATAVNVADGTAPGFVRTAADSRYFVDDRGNTFYPIGLNMAWVSNGITARQQTMEYDRMLEDLAANGGNFIRIWLAPWSFNPEWDDTGLGNYDARQPRSWRLDHVMARCDELGIRVMLCINNHGMFSSRVNAEWNANPLNAANGGPLATPGAFLTDATAKELFRRKMRYLAARYAAYPSLFAWEWFNEMEYAEGMVSPEFGPWSDEMAAYVATVDPYERLVTTSSSSQGSALIWDVDSIGITQAHAYGTANWTMAIENATRTMNTKWHRPFLFGEFGMDAQGAGVREGGWYLHSGNWASLFGGASGGAMTWWWDSLVFAEQSSLAWRYKGLARFLEGERLHDRPVRFSSATTRAGDIPLELRFVHLSETSFLWVRRADATEATAYLLVQEGAWFPTLSDVDVPLDEVAGAASVEWWDTQEGKAVGSSPLVGSEATVRAPPFQADIAAKFRHRLSAP